MNEYEKLILKSEKAKQNALRSESDWARWFWADVSEKLYEKALKLPVSSLKGE